MIVALFIMGAAVPQALLKRADEASGAYVSCLFGVSRQANAARLPVAEFERKLEASCQAEERLVTDLDRRIFTLRGEPSPQSLAEELARDARRQVIESCLTAAGWPAPAWFETTAQDTGTGQARHAVAQGAQIVFVCGGDGTVRSVIAGLIGTEAALAPEFEAIAVVELEADRVGGVEWECLFRIRITFTVLCDCDGCAGYQYRYGQSRGNRSSGLPLQRRKTCT